MFTVDSMNVIDATHRGNKARFINHNCQVNFTKQKRNQNIKKEFFFYFSQIVLLKLFYQVVLNILLFMH
jgi:quinol-cytochrome oxidoreductase complex cytochrome b subunit